MRSSTKANKPYQIYLTTDTAVKPANSGRPHTGITKQIREQQSQRIQAREAVILTDFIKTRFMRSHIYVHKKCMDA